MQNTLINTYISLTLLLLGTLAEAAEWNSPQWSTTELQYQHGRLLAPEFSGATKANTSILTMQHASGWSFGDVFFFVDSLHDDHKDGINDHDLYGEVYLNFSLSKLLAKAVALGMVKDVGLLVGLNAARDAKVRKYLPGVRLSWNFPEFSFLNTDFMAYVDDSAGVVNGGAPKESNSYLIDVNWSYPFQLGAQSFSIEGHVEYVGSRHNEFGDPVSYSVLAQPQFRWDAGRTILSKDNRLYLGIEYQYWRNKLGDNRTTESVPQFLAVWRF